MITFQNRATMAEVEEIIAKNELPEIKMFGRWSTDDVQVSDISLTVCERINI